MATIEIALPAKRGAVPRTLSVDTARLNAVQLRVVREMLPLDKRSGRPVLRSPTAAATSSACRWTDADGVLHPLAFTFEPPATIVDDDAPALIDLWHQRLQQARTDRERRALTAALRPGATASLRKTRRKGQGEDGTGATDGMEQAGGDVQTCAPPETFELADPQGQGDGIDRRDGHVDLFGLPDTTPTDSGARPPADPAAPSVAAPAAPADRAETGDGFDTPDTVRAKLPRLGEFEIEPFAGPDAIVLANGGQALVRGAIVLIECLDLRRIVLRGVDEDLRLAFGVAWAGAPVLHDDAPPEEDLGFRIAQAREAAKQAWHGMRELAGELGLKPSRSRKPMPSLAQMVDLARHIRIDLDTAGHTVAQLMADLDAHPGWIAQFVQAVQKVHASVPASPLAAGLRHAWELYDAWARHVGAIETHAQLSLWATAEGARSHRALEPQVQRARAWRDQLGRNALGAMAALSCLELGC